MANHDPVAFEAAARVAEFLGFGFYPRSGFIQVDLGPARQSGERFPIWATAFAAETSPAREVLAESRTMKGGGATGVATLRAVGVEVAQNVAETQIQNFTTFATAPWFGVSSLLPATLAVQDSAPTSFWTREVDPRRVRGSEHG